MPEAVATAEEEDEEEGGCDASNGGISTSPPSSITCTPTPGVTASGMSGKVNASILVLSAPSIFTALFLVLVLVLPFVDDFFFNFLPSPVSILTMLNRKNIERLNTYCTTDHKHR